MAAKNTKKLITKSKSKSKSKSKLKDISNLIRVNLRLTKSVHGKIKKLALKQEVSINEMISDLIKNYINNPSVLENKNS